MINAIVYDMNIHQPVNYSYQVDENNYPEDTGYHYIYLIPYIPFAEPVYDSRYYSGVNITESYVDSPHPTYPLYKQWKITYELIPASISDILFALDNVRRLSDALLRDDDLQAQAFGELMKQVAGVSFDQTILDEWTTIANKIRSNVANAKALAISVNAGNQPNLDAGWVTS